MQTNSEIWPRFSVPLLTGGRTSATPYLKNFHIFYLFRNRSTSCWSKNRSTNVVWKCCAKHFAQHFGTTYVEQKVVQVTLINILEQHRVFAQHLEQMYEFLGDVVQYVVPNVWINIFTQQMLSENQFCTTYVVRTGTGCWSKPTQHLYPSSLNICCAKTLQMLCKAHLHNILAQHMLIDLLI